MNGAVAFESSIGIWRDAGSHLTACLPSQLPWSDRGLTLFAEYLNSVIEISLESLISPELSYLVTSFVQPANAVNLMVVHARDKGLYIQQRGTVQDIDVFHMQDIPLYR